MGEGIEIEPYWDLTARPVEDDYESENIYDDAPMSGLKNINKIGRVIYMGIISKSLSLAQRMG